MRRIRGRKEVFMATMKDIITSPLLLAMVIIGLLYIVGFSLVYLKKAYTHCLELGISKEDLKNVIKSSLVFSIVPSLSIVVGLFALISVLGTVWSWWRLSVIGSLSYESLISSSVASAIGFSSSAEMLEGATGQQFGVVMILMSIGMLSGFFILLPLGKKLSMMILLLCGALFVLQVLKGGNVADAFLFAVALAVAAIPEALSSIVTIVLAFGTRKMAKEGAIIRKLQSVEGLGSVSVICSDKTGTLTQNRMTIEHYYVDGRDIPADEIDPEDPLQGQMLRFSILCNDSTNVEGQEIGDPTETAMINLGDRGCKRCGIYGSDG